MSDDITRAAFDETRRRWDAKHIGKPWFDNAIKDKSLVNVAYDPVIPVPGYQRNGRPVSAHFRTVGGSTGKRIGSTETDTTHELTIGKLLDALVAAGSNVSCTTSDFATPSQHHEVLRCLKFADYRWVREPETRQWFADGRYIQPDLLGYDANRRSAGPNNRSVIIEVIRTHEPETSTLERLIDLSSQNHFVVFYFCGPFKRGWHGHFELPDADTQGAPLRIHSEFYLDKGVFYAGTSPFKLDADPAKKLSSILGKLQRIRALNC